LINHATPYLEKSPAAAVVVNGSIAQAEVFFSPFDKLHESPYGPHKAALAHHANIMAKVLGPKGIRYVYSTPWA
jgi:NAD(P)-dependent dehydrogenase (short-subunit alcohol dehydrogenase family)